MAYETIQIEVKVVTKPRYLGDPSTGIFKDLSKYLYKYSLILEGFPLSFEIEGVKPTGKILFDGSVYTDCLVTFLVFKCRPSDNLYCIDGYISGVFHCIVDGNDGYTGDLKVLNIENDKIIASSANILEESDF